MIKIIKLESELGYENKAVVGGLERFLPSWTAEARANNLDEATIQSVSERINQYRTLDLPSRTRILAEIIEILHEAEKNLLPPTPKLNSEHTPVTQNKPITGDYSVESAQSRPASLPQQPPKPVDFQKNAGLKAPLTVISGIGPHNALTLKSLGLVTLENLLYFFPRRYDDFSQLKPINRIEYGEELTVLGTVQSSSMRPIRGGKMQLIEVIISDGTGFLRLTWFNQPWLANKLTTGVQIIASGKVDMYLGHLVMNSPDWEQLEQEHLHTNRIVPVYPLTAKVTQKWLRKIMHQSVTFWSPRVPDYMPQQILQSAALIDLPTALRQVHFPDSDAQLQSARARLAFDEIFFLQLGVLAQKRSWQAAAAQVFTVSDEWMQARIVALPFELTQAQQRVLAETRTDLASGRPMNRLLQGDVGSGKTVISAVSAAILAENGAQTAVMAPTSILAEQHYRTFSTLLKDYLAEDEIALLVGDTPEGEKRAIRERLSTGAVKLIIGTHALLEDPVEFQRLQLAVIDEQHRFGVEQRAILRAKGENPHLLVMTATPIPRSLALTIYGDLDLSVMDEMPVGRLPIETHILHPLERERAYQLIRSQISASRQAFIICPLVEQGENEDAKAAVEERDRLQQQVFPHYQLGLLHGRMRPDEKEEVMLKFRNGEYQILVSTSVVEVGVDITNATVMLIEGANRFGLSQLHQFRGRVGRGSNQSYCLLIPESENALENERLSAMEETNDGFILAERDLEQRGPGDFLGTRQSGFLDLRMANLTDVRLIEKARNHAQRLFEIDPDLSAPEHQALLNTFRTFWGSGKGDVS